MTGSGRCQTRNEGARLPPDDNHKRWLKTENSSPSENSSLVSILRFQLTSAGALMNIPAQVRAKWDPVRQGEPLFADKDNAPKQQSTSRE
jgi:hypothetical protein